MDPMIRRRPLALLLIVLPTLALAQTPARRPASGLQAATRALIEGRYDEVASLADKLDTNDPDVVAVKARAAIARGRYQDAEALLRPIAMRAPQSEAALELGLLRKMLGGSDASGILQRLAPLASTGRAAADIARGARALRALGLSQQANAGYRDAASLAPSDPAVNTAWGELFLEKYNKPEALKSFKQVLDADPKWVPAIVGAARTFAEDDPPQAEMLAKQALSINPQSVDAYVFLAEAAADAGHKDEANEALKKALAVNPSSLDAHALAAALAYVADKQSEFESEVAQTLAIAPNYGNVYRKAGELAAHNYRFDEAVELTRRALSLDSGDPAALSDLGGHLLRTGDETGARAALEASFKLDPFDVSTFNELSLLDSLDKFETIRDGDLIFRMSKDEAGVLKEYAIPLAHEALANYSARYEFVPKGPILIEIFPKHDDFAVRTVGLPGMLGATGACFGRVVTLESTKARPPGTYQWQATLWHELAHVITIQMSNSRVPRWLTEGISVYEEKRAHADWARPQDVEFASMLEHGQAIKLKDLNAAFQDPRKISIAYFQGELVVDYILKTYGPSGMNKLLRTFGQGLDTDAALKQAFNTSFEQMQAGFDQMLDARFGSIRRAMATPGTAREFDRMPLPALRTLAAGDAKSSYPVQMALGRALQRAGELDEAVKAYERAAALVPMPVGKDSPHDLIAAIALDQKNRPRAIAELEAVMAVDFDNIDVPRRLVKLFKEDNVSDPAKLSPIYERISALDPYDVDAHTQLGRLAMQRNDADRASREFRAALALAPVDRAPALTDLAESYFKAGKAADAKKQTLAALEIAPTYERAQQLLLKLVAK
jgi:tetratricopeptide (TPR) repeat protein